MTSMTSTTMTLDAKTPRAAANSLPLVVEDYYDAFVTLSPSRRLLTVQHPGIPLLGSTHTIPLQKISFLKCAAELDLEPSEYKVWGPGPSWIWWAWDLRRAGLLKRTERERCFIARVEVVWTSIWIGFTVEDVERFRKTLEACELVHKGISWNEFELFERGDWGGLLGYSHATGILG